MRPPGVPGSPALPPLPPCPSRRPMRRNQAAPRPAAALGASPIQARAAAHGGRCPPTSPGTPTAVLPNSVPTAVAVNLSCNHGAAAHVQGSAAHDAAAAARQRRRRGRQWRQARRAQGGLAVAPGRAAAVPAPVRRPALPQELRQGARPGCQGWMLARGCGGGAVAGQPGCALPAALAVLGSGAVWLHVHVPPLLALPAR